MYHERKDYSVINLDVALKVYEEIGFLTEFESIHLIVFVQSMSEKGISNLLLKYIMQHEPKIILSILEKFNFTDLQISWFDLPKKYIDFFPDSIFQFELQRILKYNRHSKEIDFKDIENVFR